MEEIITKFDDGVAAQNYDEAYDLIKKALNNENMVHPDLLWRLARVCRDMGKPDKTVYRGYLNEGLNACERGLEIDPEHPKCHCWAAIHLNYLSDIEGIDQRIKNAFKMKEHWMTALKREPNDAVTLHSLGRWCFEVTDLPYLKRKFAQVFFGTPPTSTYEDALEYLLASERASPKLIATNSLFLAKTYHRLKRKDDAKIWCESVLTFTSLDKETVEAKREASQLLKSL